MRHTQCIAQPIGQSLARGHRAVRGDLVDDVVHTRHHHGNVEMRQAVALLLLKQTQGLGGGQARLRHEPPTDPRRAALCHQRHQLAGQR